MLRPGLAIINGLCISALITKRRNCKILQHILLDHSGRDVLTVPPPRAMHVSGRGTCKFRQSSCGCESPWRLGIKLTAGTCVGSAAGTNAVSSSSWSQQSAEIQASPVKRSSVRMHRARRCASRQLDRRWIRCGRKCRDQGPFFNTRHNQRCGVFASG